MEDTIKTLPLNGMRKAIAVRMKRSLNNSAQLTHMMQADVTSMMEIRARRNASADDKISVNDVLIKTASDVLMNHKYMNGWIDEKEIRTLNSVHMGMAVSLENGLIVPVIKNADKKSISSISAEAKLLAGKARGGTLTPAECTGGTFTISNLGAYRLQFFTPIINEPEIAILGVGGIIETPALIDGEWQIRRMLPLSLTFDHCAVDGDPAAAFLQDFCLALENITEQNLL